MIRKETDFIKYLSRDLQILLKMPFNHFMSHIIYDDNLKRTLSSFFQYSPRVYDDNRDYCYLHFIDRRNIRFCPSLSSYIPYLLSISHRY